MKKLLIFLKFFLILLGINLIIGFISFIILIQNNFSDEKIILKNTKFIVVATGGSNRILRGINLIEENYDRKMLISGVGKGIGKMDIAKAINANNRQLEILNCCIDLDLSATNTKGNAQEAHIWLKKNKAKSSFLVTANYHMPRLILEFKEANPKIILNIVPVIPILDPIKKIYLPKNFNLLTKEYIKYIITKAKIKLI